MQKTMKIITDITPREFLDNLRHIASGDMSMSVYNTIHTTTSWKLISRKLYSCNPALTMNRQCGVARCSRYP